VLDFGRDSVDGWLTRLLGAELGVAEGATLDDESREFVFGERRIALSDREYDVLRYLWDHEGQVVDRGELLEEVWEGDYDGGSNVVDVVIRGLRRKLSDHASMIETLRGRGYRFRNG
jgi:DNA-binding response OmpR family regulator